MREPTFLDCCETVSLHTVRVLYESHHELEALKTCVCGASWFHRFGEYVNWSPSPRRMRSRCAMSSSRSTICPDGVLVRPLGRHGTNGCATCSKSSGAQVRIM
jgi:hypothetical protein